MSFRTFMFLKILLNQCQFTIAPLIFVFMTLTLTLKSFFLVILEIRPIHIDPDWFVTAIKAQNIPYFLLVLYILCLICGCLSCRAAVEKLRCVDDAFHQQLESVQATHQMELLQLANEKQKQIEQANQKVNYRWSSRFQLLFVIVFMWKM